MSVEGILQLLPVTHSKRKIACRALSMNSGWIKITAFSLESVLKDGFRKDTSGS